MTIKRKDLYKVFKKAKEILMDPRTKWIKGNLSDGANGRCAFGAIYEAATGDPTNCHALLSSEAYDVMRNKVGFTVTGGFLNGKVTIGNDQPDTKFEDVIAAITKAKRLTR